MSVSNRKEISRTRCSKHREDDVLVTLLPAVIYIYKAVNIIVRVFDVATLTSLFLNKLSTKAAKDVF